MHRRLREARMRKEATDTAFPVSSANSPHKLQASISVSLSLFLSLSLPRSRSFSLSLFLAPALLLPLSLSLPPSLSLPSLPPSLSRVACSASRPRGAWSNRSGVRTTPDLIWTSIHHEHSVSPSIRPIWTRCCVKMANMIQVCNSFR